jgi:PAS domain S-box-containing protein
MSAFMRLKEILQGFSLSRRLFLIFLFCGLIPLILFFGLFSVRLEEQVKEQTFQRIRFQTKALSLSIMDRLLQLESEMRFFISSSWDASCEKSSPFIAIHASTSIGHFEELIHLGPGGATSLLGVPADTAAILPADFKPASLKKAALIQRKGIDATPQLWMAVSLSDSEFMIGRIDRSFLWNEEANYNLPPQNEICIIGESDAVLVSSLADPGNLVRAVADPDRAENSSALTWNNGADVHMASVYHLFLGGRFLSSPWRVIVTRPMETLLEPIRSFQLNVALTGLLIALIAFLASSVAIRRSLKPLDRLVADAAAMGAGDFSTKADIQGSPELQELSETFNTMARQVAEQFADLQKNEEQFRIAFDDAAVGMALVSLKGRILRANPFLADLLGYSRENLLSATLQDILCSETAGGDQTELGAVLSGDRPYHQAFECRFRHRDGRVIHGLVNSSLLCAISGEPLHYIFHVQDITRQKEMAEVSAAREKAEIANRAKSEFLANMSHELRTPLNHIIGFTELISSGIAGELNPQQKEYLDDVVRSSQHLLSLVNDILDLAKVEAGKHRLEIADIEIRDILENSLVMIKEKALKHGIELTVSVDGVPDTIRADERKLKQILYNLLSNAVKFTPDGGRIALTARPCQAEAEVPSAAGGYSSAHILISVSDSGAGLNPEDLDRIFLPFEQAAASGHQKIQGTGLGLPLSRQFVELHGGKLWATSEGLQRGTTFYFTLPIKEF